MNEERCSRCGKEWELPSMEEDGLATLDVWIFDSLLWDGETKTGEQPCEVKEDDYVTFCTECRPLVIERWKQFVRQTKGETI